MCSVQEYAWGKIGSSSQVARLAGRACPSLPVKEDTTYAELWMGTHTNGPARLGGTGQLLAEFISDDPSCLGEKVRKQFGDQLPYLFKILSVGKALSIQAHPNKAHAEILHKERPEVYKDPNHKPEIAIALTDFEGLCGFRPLAEIQGFLNSVPELAAVLGPTTSPLLAATLADYTQALRDCFLHLMECDKSALAGGLAALSARLSSSSSPDSVSQLFQRLHSQYPGDVGCFVIYFLNIVRLSPGEAMFLGPNVPHAYLAGDCVECMANSDNVVRAGLTPKLIDTPTLVGMLDYTCSPAESRKFCPVPGSNAGCLEFDPPVPDFAVARHQIGGDCQSYSLAQRDSASIVIVTEGQGKFLASDTVMTDGNVTVVKPFASSDIAAGSVVFIPANKTVEVFPEGGSQVVAFQAYCSL